MPTTLMAVWIEAAEFYDLAAAIQPFNLNIGPLYFDRFSQRWLLSLEDVARHELAHDETHQS